MGGGCRNVDDEVVDGVDESVGDGVRSKMMLRRVVMRMLKSGVGDDLWPQSFIFSPIFICPHQSFKAQEVRGCGDCVEHVGGC